MSIYVTDTHPLIWYATGNNAKLSNRALRAFNSAAREEALIYVPPFVLWEIAIHLKTGRIAHSLRRTQTRAELNSSHHCLSNLFHALALR